MSSTGLANSTPGEPSPPLPFRPKPVTGKQTFREFYESQKEALSARPNGVIADRTTPQVAAIFFRLGHFFEPWVPESFAFYGNRKMFPSGSVDSKVYWEGLVRLELHWKVYSEDFLKREATEDEMDWLVDNVMEGVWDAVQKLIAKST